MRHRHERMAGRIAWGTLFWLMVLVSIVYITYRVLPVYVHIWTFEDQVKETLLQVASYRARRAEPQLREQILRLAREEGVPVDYEDIEFQWFPTQLIVRIRVQDAIRLPGYTWKIDRLIEIKRPLF